MLHIWSLTGLKEVQWYCVSSLTHVELGDIEHTPPADHVLPLNVELQWICSLPRRDKLWAQKPVMERQDSALESSMSGGVFQNHGLIKKNYSFLILD